MKYLPLFITLLFSCLLSSAQKNKSFDVTSPNGNIQVHIDVAGKLLWSIKNKSQQIIEPSAISLQLQNETLGDNASITSSKTERVTTTINAINYIKAVIADEYNQLTLNCKNDYGIIFRVYNDAVAYRFFTKKKTASL